LPEQGLQLFETLDAGRQPVLQKRFGRHGVETGHGTFLDLLHQHLLHRPHIGQTEKSPGLLWGTIDIDGDLHRLASLRLARWSPT
jgi:hypothetical protein